MPPDSGYRRVDMQDCHERQSFDGPRNFHEAEASFPILEASAAAGLQGGESHPPTSVAMSEGLVLAMGKRIRSSKYFLTPSYPKDIHLLS